MQKKLFTVAGITLLIILIARTDLHLIYQKISSLKGNAVLLLLFSISWYVPQTGGWIILSRKQFKLNFFFLLFIKIAADSVNSFLPLAGFGGESFRTMVLKKRLSLLKGFSSIFADKTIDLVAGTIFMTSGLLIALLTADMPNDLLLIMLTVVTLSIIGCVLLLRFNSKQLARIISKIPILNKKATIIIDKIINLEKELHNIFRNNKIDLTLATLLHLISRVLKVCELWILFKLLNVPFGFIEAYTMSAMITLINTAFFIVPGQLGVTEGGHILIFKLLASNSSLQNPAAIGLTIAILRRSRKIFFSILSLPLLGYLHNYKPQKKD